MFHSSVSHSQKYRALASSAHHGVLGLAPALIYAGMGAALVAANLKLLHASTLAFLAAAVWSYFQYPAKPERPRETSREDLSRFVFAGLAIYGALTLCMAATTASGWADYASFGLSVALGAMASVVVNQLISLAPATNGKRRARRALAADQDADIA